MEDASVGSAERKKKGKKKKSELSHRQQRQRPTPTQYLHSTSTCPPSGTAPANVCSTRNISSLPVQRITSLRRQPIDGSMWFGGAACRMPRSQTTPRERSPLFAGQLRRALTHSLAADTCCRLVVRSPAWVSEHTVSATPVRLFTDRGGSGREASLYIELVGGRGRKVVGFRDQLPLQQPRSKDPFITNSKNPPSPLSCPHNGRQETLQLVALDQDDRHVSSIPLTPSPATSDLTSLPQQRRRHHLGRPGPGPIRLAHRRGALRQVQPRAAEEEPRAPPRAAAGV